MKDVMMTDEPQWLVLARELQAIAQSGLAYADGSPFDRERYEAVRDIASKMMAMGSDEPAPRIADLFAGQRGYATPKATVRGAVFDAQGRILLVREVLDHGRWTLPGGWADVNLSPVENTIKEVREESGYIVRVTRLAAVWDRARQAHPPGPFSCYTLCFICELLGGTPTTSTETSEIGWFARDAIPEDLSLGRVLHAQIDAMFDYAANPALPTWCD
ncbi:NUDIX hydrolase N-terminal domain-containing protein [Gluconacetobacter entanii]|uniref:NUDIX hydrolase N-terminal domain-containing protein n=1 Tax=Gluconacetobacter entanii TaxID=108528 RepID=A0ABT3K8U1_9PROT|nr:NUDIX hydrolase N-terminal domain-containing protein [Gluconacetobacter entanii]MCW4579766.1 NUDIX hydrolase N-terminal domain-containing protein [Gluconacetobacter entanii]MCW4583170.1 NUDIX hydrolase N-terminal domain-containing protein [Gluconacetobacter entanii]MCW4586562.1 NUDIX hydrolase N-terminal domain-containing protein [Gluconacetobacter entanii]MCW4591854.1 NUDIX hydrolase N-terminal domain-containing protein [Gluconacetobacter entanii]MCW4595023.1 NUDIX hydrolase N-terminal dom